MALQLKDKTYLKIDAEGNYIIYKNKTVRNKEKKLSSTEVIAKYREILNGYALDAETVYYAPDIVNEYIAWKEEYDNYLTALQYQIPNYSFPLISQYFSNVKDSLPQIISRGQLGIPQNKTTKEVYEFIKQHEFFGSEDEIKDV